MSTTYTAKTQLRKPAQSDRSWHTPLNENADLLDALAPVGGLAVALAEVPSASLNVKVAAGRFKATDGTEVSYAGTASQAVTTATTNYVYLTNAGTLTVNTTGFPATAHVPLAVVAAGATTIASVTDRRPAFSVINGAVAPSDATYIVSTASAGLSAEFALSTLSTGLLKVTTTTGALTTAVAGTDYQAADSDLTAIAALASNGVIARTGTGTAAVRTITGTSNQITVTNGDGVSGNPTLATPQNIHTGASPTFAGMTFGDAGNLAVGSTTGTKIGTATTQKLGLWNATPIIQPASANQAALTDSTTGTPGTTINDVTATPTQSAINSNFASVVRLLNQLRSDLVAAGIIKGSA